MQYPTPPYYVDAESNCWMSADVVLDSDDTRRHKVRFAINKPGGLACQFCVGQGRGLRRSGHTRGQCGMLILRYLQDTASSSDFRTTYLSASRSPCESRHLPSPSPTTCSYGIRTACLCSAMMSRLLCISSQHPEGTNFARCHTNHSSRPSRIVDRTGMAVNVSLTAAALPATLFH